MKKLALTPLFLLLWFFLIWCSQLDDSTNSTNKELVKIWVIAPLSWPASTYWWDAINVYKDALKDYENDAIDLEVIYENGWCNAKDASSAAQKLMNVDNVDFILWWLCSGETIAPAKLAQDNWTLLFSPTASSPVITHIWDKIFRLWNDADSWKVAWPYLTKNYDRIALIVEWTDYAKWLATALEKTYQWTITTKVQFDTSEKDYSVLAKQLAQEKNQFDWIVIVNQTESTGIWLLKWLDSVGLVEEYRWSIVWFYLFTTETIIEQIPDLVEWNIEVQIAWWETMWEKSIEYTEYFEKTYWIESIAMMVSLEKEAIQLLLDGISAWNYTTESMKTYFESIHKNNPRDWYIGEWYFDENGDAVWLKYVMQKIVNGEGVVLE